MTTKSHGRAAGVGGFTLIELMIVVAVIAILASIAYPSYQSHIMKTRRGAAAACVLEAAQFMERFYTTKLTYVGAIADDGAGVNAWSCQNDQGGHYAVALSAVAARSYTITASPTSTSQLKDLRCKALSINQSGAKGIGGTGSVQDCW